VIGPQLRQTPTTPCKLWDGRKDKNGYGRYPDGEFAHRVEWMRHYGIITDLQINHLCINKDCYEIAHIYAGTQAQNNQDQMRDGTNANANKTECPKGHPYDEENTVIIWNGGRACRICKSKGMKLWRLKNRDEINKRQREKRNAKKAK
jgi:hypothetical protein